MEPPTPLPNPLPTPNPTPNPTPPPIDPSYPTPEELAQPGSLGEEIKAHWKEHRPTLYQQLSHEGQLNKMASEVELQILEKMRQMWQQGIPEHEAWELVREEAFPPDEEAAPELGLDPARLVRPTNLG